MAEAGSFADRVKQQADIVRVIGEYVRLKKSGQNFSGLCPFHQEKTPSFSVSPVKQMYYCFRFRERRFFQFHHKLKNVAAFAATETVIHLLHRADTERRSFFLMERAQAAEILPTFLQPHVFADDPDNVRLLLDAIRE